MRTARSSPGPRRAARRPYDGRRNLSLQHAHRLDVVAVRIEKERAVVVGRVVRAQPRRAVVFRTRLEAGGVEAIHGVAAGRAQGYMAAGVLWISLRVQPER